MPPTTKLVAYYRVSSKQQGESGLGLEAQENAVNAFTAGVAGKIVATYKEVETGKNDARPQLALALAHAKRIKATLVIAKLDRLARSMAFVANLMDSGVDFIACDNPHANRLTLHILAAVADNEVRMISERTKVALAAAKRRGVLLGSARPGHWEGREDARARGQRRGVKAAADARNAESEPVYSAVRPIIRSMHASGASLRQIADKLNVDNLTTPKGGKWFAPQVARLID